MAVSNHHLSLGLGNESLFLRLAASPSDFVYDSEETVSLSQYTHFVSPHRLPTAYMKSFPDSEC